MSDEGDDKPGVSVDGKLVVTDLLGLGKAVEKLSPAATKIVEVVAAGFGKLYEPASIYLNAQAQGAARRHNALNDAKAYLELETRSPAVLQSMRERVLGVEYRRELLIQSAQAEAAHIAQGNTSEKATDIDPDFFIEWMEGVKDVSHAQLRNAWSKMLAEAPNREEGRVAKPIVDFLRQLDSQLAAELKWVWEHCLPATNYMSYLEADTGELAEEIGIGSKVEMEAMFLQNGWLTFQFNHDPNPVFQLSARATELAQIIFPPRNQDEALLAFLERMDKWLLTISISYGSPYEIVLWVTVEEGSQVEFSITMNAATTDNSRERAIDRILKMPDDPPQYITLKKTLTRLAEGGVLRYIQDTPYVEPI